MDMYKFNTGFDNLGKKNAGNSNSGNFNCGHFNSGNFNSGSHNYGHHNTGKKNYGHWNSGDFNSGHRNSGISNAGHANAGCFNSGNYNSGTHNPGSFNSGNHNSGDFNSGHFNSGLYNSGEFNSGSFNSGSYNSGNYNSGIFNTIIPPKTYAFNKECDWAKTMQWDKPDFLYFKLTEWIISECMSDEEKILHPTYKFEGGYEKKLDYKEAFRKSWDKAELEDRKKILTAPNFDNEIFKEISGIDVYKELNIDPLTQPKSIIEENN